MRYSFVPHPNPEQPHLSSTPHRKTQLFLPQIRRPARTQSTTRLRLCHATIMRNTQRLHTVELRQHAFTETVPAISNLDSLTIQEDAEIGIKVSGTS